MSGWTIIGQHPLCDLAPGVPVAIDTETEGLDFQSRLLGISLAWMDLDHDVQSCYLVAPSGQSYMDFEPRTEIPIQHVLTSLQRLEVVFHNQAFDHRMLFKANSLIPLSFAGTHDTMHLAPLVGWQASRSLENLVNKYLPGGMSKRQSDAKKKRKKLAGLPIDYVAEYATGDAEDTFWLFRELYQLREGIIDDVFYDRDRAYADVTMKMVERGLPLDFEWCIFKEREFERRIMEIGSYFRDKGVGNLLSNQEVANYLFKIRELPYTKVTATIKHGWPQGIPSVDKTSMEAIKSDPEVAMIIEYRELVGAIGKWLRSYREDAAIDGRVHSALDPFGTVSGRIAATNPNVTAIAMESRGTAFGSMLGMFKGHDTDLWAFDMSQAEVRLASVYAHDYDLMRILSSKRDPYVEMSERVWSTTSRRNDAKRALLATIYEVGPEKFSITHNVPYAEADEILHDFRNAFPKIKQASRLDSRIVEHRKVIKSYAGRPRWFGPDEEAYKAFNQKVQMGIAEIIRDAIINVENESKGSLSLQIHDSLIMEIPKGDTNAIDKIRDTIEKSVPTEFARQVSFPVKPKLWQSEE